MRKSLLAIFLAGIAALAAADEISTRQSQLDAIKSELESKRAQYDSLGQKQKSEMNRLHDLEEQASLSGQLLLKIKRENEALSGSIKVQKIKLMVTDHQLEQRREVLFQRLRYIYKLGNQPEWFQVISSGNPTEALAAYKNMGALVAYDKHLLQSYNELSQALESGLVRYQSDAATLKGLQGDQENELRQREKTLAGRKKLVNKLKKNRSEVEKSISKLEEDAAQISGIIESLQVLEQAAPPGGELPGLTQGKGNLIWPVRGRIIREFGTLTDKRGIKSNNPGIDIQSKLGNDVMAAATGIVIYISYLRGYGQFIIVNHGQGYYTLYANLSDIFVETGEEVRAGEAIGLVGDSGSLEGPKLHFELRYKKGQLNPMEWLR